MLPSACWRLPLLFIGGLQIFSLPWVECCHRCWSAAACVVWAAGVLPLRLWLSWPIWRRLVGCGVPSWWWRRRPPCTTGTKSCRHSRQGLRSATPGLRVQASTQPLLWHSCSLWLLLLVQCFVPHLLWPRPSPGSPPLCCCFCCCCPPPTPQVLPYWGLLNDRKTLRRLFAPGRLYGRAAPFHVCLTSYQIAVADEAVLKKVKWQFMVLDEAQVGGGRGGGRAHNVAGDQQHCFAVWLGRCCG